LQSTIIVISSSNIRLYKRAKQYFNFTKEINN